MVPAESVSYSRRYLHLKSKWIPSDTGWFFPPSASKGSRGWITPPAPPTPPGRSGGLTAGALQAAPRSA